LVDVLSTKTVSDVPSGNPSKNTLPVTPKLPVIKKLPENTPTPFLGKKFSPTKSPAFNANEAVCA
jgi:hypothetical protein